MKQLIFLTTAMLSLAAHAGKVECAFTHESTDNPFLVEKMQAETSTTGYGSLDRQVGNIKIFVAVANNSVAVMQIEDASSGAKVISGNSADSSAAKTDLTLSLKNSENTLMCNVEQEKK